MFNAETWPAFSSAQAWARCSRISRMRFLREALTHAEGVPFRKVYEKAVASTPGGGDLVGKLADRVQAQDPATKPSARPSWHCRRRRRRHLAPVEELLPAQEVLAAFGDLLKAARQPTGALAALPEGYGEDVRRACATSSRA